MQLVDVYGLPGDVYTRTPEGGLLMDLATLFLSRERGGIFLSFASDGLTARGPKSLGRASLSYLPFRGAAPERSAFDLVVRSENAAGLGLNRGELLVNEYEALRAASIAFYETGDVAAAQAQTKALLDVLTFERDEAFAREYTMMRRVVAFLELASADPALTPAALRKRPHGSPLVGIWKFDDSETEESAPAQFVVLLPGGRAAFVDDFDEPSARVANWKGRRISARGDTAGSLVLADSGLVYESRDPDSLEMCSWPLQRWRPFHGEGEHTLPQ